MHANGRGTILTESDEDLLQCHLGKIGVGHDLTAIRLHDVDDGLTSDRSLEVKSAVPYPKYQSRACRRARHRDQKQVKSGKDWIPLQVPPSLMETIEANFAYDKPKVGWCLLCNSPIETADDFIPETNTHSCPEGLRLHEGCKEL